MPKNKKSVLPSARSKLSKQLIGISGEYFVAAELSRRGFLAAITLRNSDSVDILASPLNGGRPVKIQVKCSVGKSAKWLLSIKAEKWIEMEFYYVFVALSELDRRPDFYIVPSKTVASFVSASHRDWLNTPDRDGNKHNDSSLRVFKDPKKEFLERWDLLNAE